MGSRRRATASAPRLGVAARIVLGVIFAGIAALVLVAVELGLTIARYGPPRELFEKRTVAGQEMYVLNRRISELFFPPWATKPPGFERFPVTKAPGTLRIFATGESSTMGDPFGPQTAFPRILMDVLADVAPEHPIEMANAGIVAISSLDVLLLHKQIVDRYEPDLVVVYTGHNEAYGADGIDTPVQRSFSSRQAAKFSMWLRNRRLSLFIRDRAAKARGASQPSGPAEGFGMWLMKDRVVPSSSSKHDRLLRFYRENLVEMLAAARERGVDVALCTNISNLRDQSPFASTHGPRFDSANGASFDRRMAEGAGHMSYGRWPEAAEVFRELVAADAEYASAHFRLARCLDALGDSASASIEYRAARDLDAVHFRACSAENQVVRDVARTWDTRGRHKLVLVDLEQMLDARYPNGVGREFFTEHVHPYPRGHAWMAEAIAKALSEGALGPAFGTWDFSKMKSPQDYVAQAGMSGLDEAAGLVLTDRFKLAKWPFTECYDNSEARTRIQREIASITTSLDAPERDVLTRLMNGAGDLYDYGQRRYLLAGLYKSQRNGPAALRQLELVGDYWGPQVAVETDQAQVYAGLREFGAAREHLDRARAIDSAYPPVHFVAGAILHGEGAAAEAALEFRKYLELDPRGVHASQAQMALQMLGAAR